MFNLIRNILKKIKFLNLIKDLIRTKPLDSTLINILPDIVCIDVGASYFEHYKWRIFLKSKKTLWIASDPNFSNLDYFKNINYNCRIKTIKDAIHIKEGLIDINITNIDSGSSVKSIEIPEIMKMRVDQNYFFPLKNTKINATTINNLLNDKINVDVPVFIKLDTQGSEFDIIKSIENLIKNNQILGIETESSLVADPCYKDGSKFHKINKFLEDNNFELIKLDVFTMKNSLEKKNNSFIPNECDSVFAIKQNEIKKLDLDKKKAMLAFYYCYSLYQEMNIIIENNPDLKNFLINQNHFMKIKKEIYKRIN